MAARLALRLLTVLTLVSISCSATGLSCCDVVEGCKYSATKQCECPTLTAYLSCKVHTLKQQLTTIGGNLFGGTGSSPNGSDPSILDVLTKDVGRRPGNWFRKKPDVSTRVPEAQVRVKRQSGTYEADPACCETNFEGLTYGCSYQDTTCLCPSNFRSNMPSCELATTTSTTTTTPTPVPKSGTFVGKTSCCNNYENPTDFNTGQLYCSYNANSECVCQDVSAADICRGSSTGTFQAKDDCCNGNNLNGLTYGCA
ncbi:unnamed protein product, partial [Lymnaea stagnalis]